MTTAFHIQNSTRAACVLVLLAAFATSAARAVDAAAPDAAENAASEFTVPADFDWSQLDTTSSTFLNKPLKSRRKALPSDPEMSWKRDDKADGASNVTVKQSVVPFWDTRIGADMNVVTKTPTTSSEVLAQKIAHDNQLAQSSGSAWAAMTAPGVGSLWDKTTIEARMDPGQDQSKLGTSLEKSLPFGEQYALTFQNGYRVVQQAGVPLTNLGRPTRNYEVDQSAKLSIGDTGTSFLAGQTLSTADDKWLRKVGAEQKLFGGISITGSVAETPEGVVNRSLTAGYKYTW